jgi:hypothetical protein
MARKEYLSYEERLRFDSPPILTNLQRAIFLQLPEWAEQYYKTLTTATNQVGFLMQLGYFRIACRFFESLQFRLEDITFVQKAGRILIRMKLTCFYISNQPVITASAGDTKQLRI